MNRRQFGFALYVLFATVFSTVAHAQASGADPLVLKMAANERQMLASVGKSAPLVETYLQVIRKDGDLPAKDRYFLHRIDLGNAMRESKYDDPGRPRHFNKFARLAPLAIRHAPVQFDSAGFIEMLSPDIHGFQPSNYRLEFARNEFLGSLKTAVYDVVPLKTGKFQGRFWITEDGHLVRFMGAFSSRSKDRSQYAHFDSWRLSVKGGDWLPSAVYIEEPLPEGVLRGQIRVWGYGIEALRREQSNVTVSVENAVDRTNSNVNVDPLTALHEWQGLATANILEKMERAGVLAPRGSMDKILDQIVTNLAVPNDLAFTEPLQCRIMLTTPIEATTVGNTILVSKGFIETLPSEEAIASVIAFELAHIVKGTTVDTKFSFADRTMFADRHVSREFMLQHSAKDNEAAANYGVALLGKSMYADKLDNISLYYQQMLSGVGRLKELFRPEIGDSMVSPEGSPWLLAALAGKGPRLEPGNPRQLSALPLGSNLVVDPWSGEVSLNADPRIAPRTADEKRPFGVSPVYYRLRPFCAPGSQVVASAAVADSE